MWLKSYERYIKVTESKKTSRDCKKKPDFKKQNVGLDSRT